MHFVKICQFFAHGPMLSPKTPSPNKAHSLTIFNEHQKQKRDSTNDNSPCICSGRTLTRSNCIGASRNDGLSGFKSSPLMKKPSNPDRVSTCESFTSNESRGTSTIPTGQPQRVAMVMPSTEASLLFYPFSYQQHHGVTQHHTDYSCCSMGNVPVKLHSWDTPHRAEKKDPSSSLTRDEEEKEWATNLAFASQNNTGCAKPAAEEEEEGTNDARGCTFLQL